MSGIDGGRDPRGNGPGAIGGGDRETKGPSDIDGGLDPRTIGDPSTVPDAHPARDPRRRTPAGRTVPGANYPPTTEPVTFSLDGTEITAEPGETILQAAERHGLRIPRLCYMEGMRADGNCRACVVEIEGERVLAPSCCRSPKPGMKVSAKSDRAIHSQRMVLELLLSDMPETPHRPDSELRVWADTMGVTEPRFAAREQPAPDFSHPAIEVRLDACIQCTRCVRACREVQVNDVIGYASRGHDAKIVFDLDDPMGVSTCVACGECVQACPTGALLPAVPLVVRAALRRED
jgi:formate dehydrogenase major subunit